MITHSEPSSASARDVRTAGEKNLVTLTKTSPPTLLTCDTSKPTPESLYDNPPEFLQSLLTISEHHQINIASPSAPEIKQVLSKFKNGKAANDITPEPLKYARNSKRFLDELTSVLNEIWTTSTVPKTWGLARLTCLFKIKGSRKDPEMYRGLSVSSSLCKLAVCIILSRQNGWYEAQLSEPQHGFRANRGTQDAILTFKSLQQISSRMKTKVYCAFVDLTAAFDLIQHPLAIQNTSKPTRLPRQLQQQHQLSKLCTSQHPHT